MMCTNIEQNMTKNMNLIRGVDKNIKKKTCYFELNL